MIFQRALSPELFDTIIRLCNEQGVAIVPASARNLRCDNVDFFRLQPDEVRIDVIAAWLRKEPLIAWGAFVNLLSKEIPPIRKKADYNGNSR